MPWRTLTSLRTIKSGDTLRVNDGSAFVIQAVIGSRGHGMEVITEEGFPLEIWDTDEVWRLEAGED